MPKISEYFGRLSQLLSVLEIEMHVEEVTGVDKSLDVVVDIFNRANSSGTRLSKGDLALAKICADWPEARDMMKQRSRSVSAKLVIVSISTGCYDQSTRVLSGKAKFSFLHEKSAAEVQNGLKTSTKDVDACLNHDRWPVGPGSRVKCCFGRYAVPLMVRYLWIYTADHLMPKERDRLLFWYIQAGMWGRLFEFC